MHLNNRLATMYNAIQTGRKDRRIGNESRPDLYNARPESAWSKWYQWGFDGLPAPQELVDAGVKIDE